MSIAAIGLISGILPDPRMMDSAGLRESINRQEIFHGAGDRQKDYFHFFPSVMFNPQATVERKIYGELICYVGR